MTQPKKPWRPSRRGLLLLATGLLLFLAAGPPMLSWLLNRPGMKTSLLARMEASFGRPVEVSNFSVSLLGGLRVEANYVTVAEDPRFGNEFFLRAEQITASLRWAALFRGRLEFGNLALQRPSVNLVRNADGQWNVLAWLPPAGQRTAAPVNQTVSPPRLYRIEVEGGRINFKSGDDKRPFALQEVTGGFSQTGEGNWQVDFVAQAFRAGSIVQEPGELRVRGTIGGTESRIVPADVSVTWNEASVADVLRLLRGRDFGVRGNLAAELHVKTEGRQSVSESSWDFTGSARIDGLHGWQLPPRSTDPAISLQVDASWLPAKYRVTVKKALLESAASSIQIEGEAGWGEDARASALQVRSAGLALADAFAFYRAFRSDVSLQARMEGMALLDAEFSGWPLRVSSFRMHALEGLFSTPAVERPITFRDATVQFNHRRDQFEFLPLALIMRLDVPERARRLVVTPMELRWEGTLRREDWSGNWSLSGQASSARTMQTLGNELGLYSVRAWQSAGWNIDGPLALKLQWRTSLFPFRAKPEGYVEVRRAQISAPLLQGPVDLALFKVEFADATRFNFAEASTLGGQWTGTLTSTANHLLSVIASSTRLDSRRFDQALSGSDTSAVHGLAAALSPANATAGSARLRAQIAISPELAAPFLQPLRPQDLKIQGSLQLSSRRSFSLSGTWGNVSVAAPPTAQR